ncbi:hypothetical protein PQX77_005638 [Marasmius sp. AFHP31]|nr:hypothetical protein PQX77_005638 [Marasmius sp. AFHP31]
MSVSEPQMYHDITYPSTFHPWQINASAVDRFVKILPGVQKMIDSIPIGRYAVATSGAETYAHGCMTHVDITPPSPSSPVTNVSKQANPPPTHSSSPPSVSATTPNDVPWSKILPRGFVSGARVIAACTSHPREKVEGNGAHFVVEDMSRVRWRTRTG